MHSRLVSYNSLSIELCLYEWTQWRSLVVLCVYILTKKNRYGATQKRKNYEGRWRQTVINVYNYFKKQFPHKSDNYIVKETCNATCTSRASFYRIKKRGCAGPPEDTKKDRKVTYCTNRYVKYNNFARSTIRRKVNSFISKIFLLHWVRCWNR
jgi:hypothetical protein